MGTDTPDRRAVGPARGCCSTTSSSCSRRSPTRRSTRSARSWSRRCRRTIGARGQPARPDARVVPADRAAVPDHRQRRAGQAHPHQRRRRPARASRRVVDPRAVPASPTAAPGCATRSTTCAAKVSEAIDDGARILVLSDRDSTDELAPIPSLLLTVGGAPPPDPREDAHARSGSWSRPATRARCTTWRCCIGYGAGAINPYLAFETIEDLIVEGRLTGGIDAHKADQELHQGRGQGRAQGDVEDGHLHGRVVHRRAGLRGDRPRPGARRRVLHRHVVAARRHRPRRDRRRGRARATRSRTRPARASAPTATSSSAASTSGAARASTTSSTRRRCSSCSTRRRAKRYDVFKEYTTLVDDQSRALATLRGLFTFTRRRAPAGADRRGRAGRRDRQALRDRRDVVRLDLEGGARDARHRDEPHRRQVEHRRGRRGRRPLRAATRTATCAARRSSRWRPAASA